MFTTYNIQDFPSNKSVNGLFMLERFEDLNRPIKLVWPHKHSFYEILWLTSGKASIVIDYHQHEIEENTLFFISPGQLHQMSTTHNVEGYTITFTQEFLLLTSNNSDKLLTFSFLDNNTDISSLKLNQSAKDEVVAVIDLLEFEVGLNEKSSIIISHLLFTLLNRIQRIIDSKEDLYDLSNLNRFKKFKSLVEHHFLKEKKLSFYADNLALTPHRVNQICKKVSGHTAGEYIRERILLESKRLLIHTDWAVGEISNYLGFEDVSYFSRQFKEKESMTPLAYRKTMFEKYQNL